MLLSFPISSAQVSTLFLLTHLEAYRMIRLNLSEAVECLLPILCIPQTEQDFTLLKVAILRHFSIPHHHLTFHLAFC